MLAWIIVFKALKAVALSAAGVALLTTRQSDPVDLFLRLVRAVHVPLTSHLADRVLAFLADLTVKKQTALAITAFGYALLMGTEGIGLYLRKPWARWFTIIATSSLIPFEVYEIARRPRPIPVAVLVANAAIVAYLWRRADLLHGAPA